MIDWQPIKTIPRDGTLVLLAQETEPGVWEYETGVCFSTLDFDLNYSVTAPTHWAHITPPD